VLALTMILWYDFSLAKKRNRPIALAHQLQEMLGKLTEGLSRLKILTLKFCTLEVQASSSQGAAQFSGAPRREAFRRATGFLTNGLHNYSPSLERVRVRYSYFTFVAT
jgi:hypothetical protein